MLDAFQKAFDVLRDVVRAAADLKGRRRRQFVATEIFICYESLIEAVKRGDIILREIEHLTREAHRENSPAPIIVLPRLEYRLRNQSFTLQRLSGSFLRLRHTLRILAPDAAERIGVIVTTKTSALLSLAYLLDRGEVPLITALSGPPPEPVPYDLLVVNTSVEVTNLAAPEQQRLLLAYVESGQAHAHLFELRNAAAELRKVILEHFTLDEILGSAGMLSARDPDGLPGGVF